MNRALGGLIIAAGLLGFAQTAEVADPVRLPIIQVVPGGKPLSKPQRDLVRMATLEEFEAIRARDPRIAIVKGDQGFFLIDPDNPVLETLERATSLLQALPLPGEPASFGKLDAGAQEGVRRTINRLFPSARIGDDAAVAITASPVFEIEVDGKRRRVSFGLDQGRPRPTSHLLSHPVAGTTPGQRPGPATLPVDSVDSTEVVFPHELWDPLDRVRAIDTVGKILEELARERMERLELLRHQALQTLLKANPDLFDEAPRQGRSLQDLNPATRERLKGAFLDSFRAYGFDSRESAEASWADARLGNAFIEFGISFAMQGADGSVSLAGIVFSSTKR